MEALNGSNDDKCINGSHFEKAHNVSGSNCFYNNWVFTFYNSQTLVHFLPQECIDWSYKQIRTKQRKQNHKRVSIVMNNIHKSSDVYFMFSLN